MKRILLGLMVLSINTPAFAQKTTGKITYKETIDLRAAMGGVELEGQLAQFAELLPKEQSFNTEMYFTPEASLYQIAKSEKEESSYREGGNTVRINFGNTEQKVFRDMVGKKTLQQREFMSRKFLITSDIKKADWKMTGKQKTILGYPCQQATMMRDTEKVVAWFTPAIPVSTGPDELGGLPGLILEAEIGKLRSIVAARADFDAFDKKILAKPTEGKKMTDEQFEAMMAEKTKEMQAEGGGNGNVIIRVQNR